MEDFKKRIHDLASKTSESNFISPEQEVERRAAFEDRKQRFLSSMTDWLKPMTDSLNDAFAPKGQLFDSMTTWDATASRDKSLVFAQVFFYPKRELIEKVGRSTPSIRFELDRKGTTVQVTMNIQHRPAPMHEVALVPLDQLTVGAVEEFVFAFAKGTTDVADLKA